MIRIVLALALALGALAAPAFGAAPGKAFLAIEVVDAERSQAWYEATFGLRQVKRIDLPNVAVRILSGERLMVEILQHKPSAPPKPELELGYSKSGLEIEDFDGALARWKAQGVKFDGEVFYDADIDFHSTLLVDPDGNLVQVFGHSAVKPPP